MEEKTKYAEQIVRGERCCIWRPVHALMYAAAALDQGK